MSPTHPTPTPASAHPALGEGGAAPPRSSSAGAGSCWLQGLALTAGLAGVTAVFWPSLLEMAAIWELDPNYSHGWMVPVMALVLGYVAWRRTEIPPAVEETTARSAAWGAAHIGLGIVVHLGARFFGNLLVDAVGLIFVLRGGLRLLGGERAYRAYGLPVLFLIFMAPLPAAWYQPAALAMQHLVSVVSTLLLEGCGIAAFREGYIIHLPGYVMEVGEACSGLRQLTAILALGVGIGFLSGRGPGYTTAVTLLAVPIAILANCLRVFGTGLILLFFGPEWADGVYHTLEGLVMVGLAALLLVGAAWLLAQVLDSRREKGSSAAGARELAAPEQGLAASAPR